MYAMSEEDGYFAASEESPADSGITLTSGDTFIGKEQTSRLLLIHKSKIIEVTNETVPVFVGRDSECDIVIAGTSASRIHGCLIFEDGKFSVSDQSRNGTWINQPGKQSTHLHDGELELEGYGFISFGRPVCSDDPELIRFSKR